ncbi:MAG TPA: hypothetical protein EYF98_04310 [Planctomycetes bacterium]|nr:hypothetical protein [Planctomycetota bacterium]
MNRKRVHELQESAQASADSALRALNCAFPVEVKIGPADDGCQGTFHPEWVEDKGMMRGLKGHIMIDDFSKLKKDELVEMLVTHVLIHELAHALQLRIWELQEDEDGECKERDTDHDAEFGLKFAEVYSHIMEDGLSEAYAKLGLTAEKREAIIASLTEAIEKDAK